MKRSPITLTIVARRLRPRNRHSRALRCTPFLAVKQLRSFAADHISPPPPRKHSSTCTQQISQTKRHFTRTNACYYVGHWTIRATTTFGMFVLLSALRSVSPTFKEIQLCVATCVLCGCVLQWTTFACGDWAFRFYYRWLIDENDRWTFGFRFAPPHPGRCLSGTHSIALIWQNKLNYVRSHHRGNWFGAGAHSGAWSMRAMLGRAMWVLCCVLGRHVVNFVILIFVHCSPFWVLCFGTCVMALLRNDGNRTISTLPNT